GPDGVDVCRQIAHDQIPGGEHREKDESRAVVDTRHEQIGGRVAVQAGGEVASGVIEVHVVVPVVGGRGSGSSIQTRAERNGRVDVFPQRAVLDVVTVDLGAARRHV